MGYLREMARRKPTIFVSSTGYDLQQIGADIRQFIEGIGCEAVLCGYDSTSMEPSAATADNCREAVESRADILFLVVGGRCGSMADAGGSITNHEYLAARAKRIPTYVFVLKSALSILPVWQANPSGDFSQAVDSPKLLEFVASMKGKVWVFPFESAQDIINVAREQMEVLFSHVK